MLWYFFLLCPQKQVRPEEEARSWSVGFCCGDGAADQRFLRFSSTLFIRALVPVGARCYHIYFCSWDTMMHHTN